MKITTHLPTSIRALFGLTSIAIALPVMAIENPAEQQAPKQKDKRQAAAQEGPKEKKKQPAKKIAMIGLGGAPVSDTLSFHLGLEEGRGLTIYHVIPGSAAAKAGLEVHDVLTEFDGRKIGTQEDLRHAVTARKPGDEVTVKYIHKGKPEEKKVTLGERNQIPHILPGGGMNPWFKGMDDMPEADRKRMQEEMRKHIDEMRKQLEQHGGMRLDLQKLFDNAGKAQPAPGAAPKAGFKGMKKLGFNAASSITMMDADGAITMKNINGKKEVIVKDKDGKILFEGPYETEQDKAAVPDDVRDRLDRLKIDQNGKKQFRLQILPGGVVPPPAEPEKDEAAE